MTPAQANALLARVLGVSASLIESLDREMMARGAAKGVPLALAAESENTIQWTLSTLGAEPGCTSHDVRGVLRKRILSDEKRLLAFLANGKGGSEFDRAADLARRIAHVGKGYFLKRDRAERILTARPPEELLKALKLRTMKEALAKHDVVELMSALRFTEPEAWMHETFATAYSSFGPSDFEERPIEVKVLGPEWHEVAQKFVEKKHHNVSHLKEFGVIFLNPIREDVPGKFLRDFALLLHYFHEIEFYAKLFRLHAATKEFPKRFAALLRGDVPEIYRTEPGEWVIVQRYLWKEAPEDPRLFLPRVNPESMHWLRGERDLTSFAPTSGGLDLSIWHNLDWVGGIFQDGTSEVVSFDLEDNAMSLVSFMEGKNESFSYHEREALWMKLFSAYVGGEDRMEELLIKNFLTGVVQF